MRPFINSRFPGFRLGPSVRVSVNHPVVRTFSSRRLFALILALGLGGASRGGAADSELGRPILHAFGRLEHKAYTLFWAPFQSREGLMYFGNQLAVMEYDGRTWRVLKIPQP